MNLIWEFLTFVGFPISLPSPTPSIYFLDAKGSGSRPDFRQLRPGARAAETSPGNQPGPQPGLHTLAPQLGKRSGPFAQILGRPAEVGAWGAHTACAPETSRANQASLCEMDLKRTFKVTVEFTNGV